MLYLYCVYTPCFRNADSKNIQLGMLLDRCYRGPSETVKFPSPVSPTCKLSLYYVLRNGNVCHVPYSRRPLYSRQSLMRVQRGCVPSATGSDNTTRVYARAEAVTAEIKNIPPKHGRVNRSRRVPIYYLSLVKRSTVRTGIERAAILSCVVPMAVLF
jgi:hypothetical protein